MPRSKLGQLETGKRWIANIFERLSAELKDTVVIAHWEIQDNDPVYCLRFQIAGQDEEQLCYTPGTLRSCGKGDLHTVRRRVEAAIRHRLTRGATDAGQVVGGATYSCTDETRP